MHPVTAPGRIATEVNRMEAILRRAPGADADEADEPRYTGTAPFAVVIDAGHGGDDVGAVGFVRECDMTAATADALLAEQCFVTNEADAAAFGSGEGIQTAARCYYRAICAYFDLEPVEQRAET